MINNVILCGRLTATPELKTTNSGTPVTGFTIAVDRRFAPIGEKRQADFINCVAWRNTAEFISKYFTKGDPIAITGEIQTRKYTDKDGNNRTAFEVIANDARFVPAKSNSNENAAPTDNAPSADIYGDDLPF